MNLQDQRIAALCEQLKMASVAADWPALAQDAAREEASHADLQLTLRRTMNQTTTPHDLAMLSDVRLMLVKLLEQAYECEAASGAMPTAQEALNWAIDEADMMLNRPAGN